MEKDKDFDKILIKLIKNFSWEDVGYREEMLINDTIRATKQLKT